jgi:hypothetical protein
MSGFANFCTKKAFFRQNLHNICSKAWELKMANLQIFIWPSYNPKQWSITQIFATLAATSVMYAPKQYSLTEMTLFFP